MSTDKHSESSDEFESFGVKGDFKLYCICGWDILLLHLSKMTELVEQNTGWM